MTTALENRPTTLLTILVITFFTTTAISTEDGSRGYVTMYYSRDYAPSTSNVQTQGIDQGDSFEDGEFTSAVAHGDLA